MNYIIKLIFQQQTLQRKKIMSHIKQINQNIEQYEQYSKSSSKRLFDSVFKILDHEQLQISSFQQSDTNGSRIVKLLQNQQFVQAIIDKIKLQQLDQLYPILKIKCVNKKGVFSNMDVDDLNAVFQNFGSIFTICQNQLETSYYILYRSFSSAYVAMKLMNNFSLRHTCSSLYVEWCPSQQYSHMNYIFNQYHSKIQWDPNGDFNKKDSNNNNQNLKQCKFTCRYDIQIQNQKDFQVARRIIGSKGTNMKKIIQSSLDQLSDKSSINLNEVLKLRLRGRGSGYKEGPEQVQSQEELHLCISAKDQAIYNFACQSVQKLLQNVYSEYLESTRKQGRAIHLQIKKSDLAAQTTQVNNQNVMKNIDVPKNGRMEPDKIQHFLQLRNKARRELNFAEADRIRNYLRACGVCLVDQKGRRGKATQVTTWKYLL